MKNKFLLIISLLIVLFAISIWFYLEKIDFFFFPKQGVKEQRLEDAKIVEFIPLKAQPAPSFIGSLKEARDIKIDFYYEGDYRSFLPYGVEFYTPENSNEKFVSLSKLKKHQDRYVYGPEYYSVFNHEESHYYGGTPIYLFSEDPKYSLSYIGFQINNKDLISELKVELGIDYVRNYSTRDKSKFSFFSSIMGIESVYACGPGTLVSLIGNSNLIFVEESKGVAWYRLEKDLALYDLPLRYSGSYYEYSRTLPDFKEGNLRMHLFYKPNDKEGFLKIQVVNFIFSDLDNKYYQPLMNKDFEQYYRAYLH